MLQLLAAIQTAFNGSSLAGSFTNGLEHSLAKNAEALPTCVLTEVSVVNDYETKAGTNPTYIETAHIQFMVRSTSGSFVRGALDSIQALFDHKAVAMTTDVLLDCRPQGINTVTREDERVYRGDVEIKFTVGRPMP